MEGLIRGGTQLVRKISSRVKGYLDREIRRMYNQQIQLVSIIIIDWLYSIGLGGFSLHRSTPLAHHVCHGAEATQRRHLYLICPDTLQASGGTGV